MLNGIEKAVAATESQSQTELANLLGVTPQAVHLWVRRGFVPPRRALEIESLLGVPRRELLDPALLDLVSTPGARDFQPLA